MWNSNANGAPFIPAVVPIPVRIPENPLTVAIPAIDSPTSNDGIGAITNGGFVELYPEPPNIPILAIPDNDPFTTGTRAVAVVAVPV